MISAHLTRFAREGLSDGLGPTNTEGLGRIGSERNDKTDHRLARMDAWARGSPENGS